MQSRLDLAKHFGATHTIDSSRLGNELVPAVQGLTEGLGASVSVDATGNLNVIKQAIEATRNLGRVCMLGVTPPGTTLDIDSTSFLGVFTLFQSCLQNIDPMHSQENSYLDLWKAV